MNIEVDGEWKNKSITLKELQKKSGLGIERVLH